MTKNVIIIPITFPSAIDAATVRAVMSLSASDCMVPSSDHPKSNVEDEDEKRRAGDKPKDLRADFSHASGNPQRTQCLPPRPTVWLAKNRHCHQ
jgi:hypothetical protein